MWSPSGGPELLQLLYNLDAKYGEFAALLAPAIHAVKEDTRRERSDRELVLLAIEQGNFLRADIEEATDLSSWNVRKALKELIRLGLVEAKPQGRPTVDRVGDSSHNKPTLLYVLKHTPHK